MQNTRLIISALNLWFFSIFLLLFKNTISILIKKNAPLSKKHIVLAFNLYERSVNVWQRKEQKHISLITNTIQKNQSSVL